MKRKIVCGLLMTCVLLIAGCGGETAVHTSAEAQSSEGASDTVQDGEADIQDGENAEAGEEDGESAQMSEHEAAAVEGNFMAPVEMDETLREQLTEEMLEENEMDVSVVENAPVTKGCSFTLPEDFAE